MYSQANNMEKKKQSVRVADKETKQIKEVHQERSERLKKDIHVTTQEKKWAYSKKRNMEGNSSNLAFSFTIDNNKMSCLANNMSIVVEEEDFDHLIFWKIWKLLETSYILKHNGSNANHTEEIVGNEEHLSTLMIEWINDKTSET